MSVPIEKITKTVGIVTSLNADHFQFVIDNETAVYAGLWSFQNGNRLPSIGETVIITTVHDHVSGCIILCDKSELVCAGPATIGGPYKTVVQERCLGAADIASIAKVHRSIEHYIEGTCNTSPNTVSIAVVSKLMERAPPREYSCQNNRLRNMNVKTVSQFRLVDNSNVAYVRLGFPNWTYGVHRHGYRVSAPELLVGYVTVSAENGVLLLQDNKNAVVCKIFNGGDAMSLIYRFILVTRCYAFTEVFTEAGVAPVQVVAFHDRHAFALSWIPKMYPEQIRVHLRPTGKHSHVLVFDLLHKGNVYMSPQGRPQCCLVVRSANGVERILVLAPNLLHVLPLLRPNRKYKLMQNAPPKIYHWHQVQRFMPKPILTHMVDSSEAIFVQAGASETRPETLLTLEQAKEHVRRHNTMFSFTGWLYEKGFCKSHVNYYAKDLPKRTDFGTPGKKTHVLYFTSGDLKMSVYLNDFEAHLAPAGLIPGMILTVRCVIPQKNIYIKATPLTTFELVDFKPIIPFDSVNLCSESRDLIKQSDSYLGAGIIMPVLTLISGRLHNVHVIKAMLTMNCAVCNNSDTCSCKNAPKQCFVNMFLKCRDSMGAFCLSTRSVDTFKQLLRFNNFQFNAIVKALHQIGTFQYKADENFKDPSPGPGRFRNMLDCAFQYCSFVLHDVPVVARRFYTKDKKPVYFSFDFNL